MLTHELIHSIFNLGYELSMRLLNVPAERRCFETETCLRTIVDEYNRGVENPDGCSPA